MSYQGKVQLTGLIVVTPDQVAEGDRLFAGHAEWMSKTHHRSGPKALLAYTVAKQPEIVDGKPTGNTVFTLTEIYETAAGPEDHLKQAGESWDDWISGKFQNWMASGVNSITAISSPIVRSLW